MASSTRRAGPVVGAGVVSLLANLLVTLAVARLLSVRGYGTLIILFGLFLVLSMPGSAIQVGVVRRITAWDALGEQEVAQRWARRLHSWSLAGIAVVVVIAVAIQGPLSRLLSFRGTDGLAEVIVAGAVWVPLSIDRGLVQARRGYGHLGGNLIVESGLKAVAIVALAAAGFGVVGAAIGLLIGEGVAAIEARWAADRMVRAGPSIAAQSEEGPLRLEEGLFGEKAVPVQHGSEPAFGLDVTTVPESGAGSLRSGSATASKPARDVAAAFLALALLAVLQNFDVILLGHLDPGHSGAYGAISVASKVLAHGAVVLSLFLLPESAIRHWAGSREVGHLVAMLGILAVPGVILLVLALAAPHALLAIVFGARLATASRALYVLVAAMMLLSGTVVLTNYFLATGRRWIVWVLAGGAAAGVTLVWRADGLIGATVRADFISQLGLFLVLSVVFLLTRLQAR